jgi:hypothetical protein
MTNSPNGQGNAVELRVVLGLNDSASKTSLNTQIALLEQKLNKVKIDVKIDPKAIAALESLAKMDFSKLTESIGKVGKETKKFATVSAEEYQKAMKKAAEITGIDLGNSIRGTAKDLKFIEQKLKGMNAKLDVKFDTKNGEKHLQAIKTTIENKGITQKVTYEKVAIMGKNNETQMLWMPKVFQDTNAQMANTIKNNDQLIAKMTKLRTEGKLTDDQFRKLSASMSGVGEKSNLARTVQQMDTMVAATARQSKELTDQARRQEELIRNEQRRKAAILDVEKAMKLQAKTLNMQDANKLLNNLKGMDVASRGFSNSLRDNQLELRRMRTVASEAGRENMGMMSAFKQAMEKFPIWMAASTLFYGTVRTASEFARIIIDIDTKMTNLSKVMSEDTNFESLFDSATLSAEKFGQSISNVLDAYTEFARQGFKGDELATLADSGLVASNVGEITAQKASEYMTASLIQWKMDAKDSMEIIDSLTQ